jgi:ribosomal protein S27AE
MLRDRFRRFHPFTAPAVPVEHQQDLAGWHGGDPDPGWTEEVDLRGRVSEGTLSTVTSCPSCESSMAVEEVDLVGRVARLVCGDCGLMRARRLPSLSSS